MNYVLGLMLVIVAAQFQATFPLPMKYIRKWNWEIIWSLYCFIGLIPLLWLVAYLRIPNLFEIFSACTARELAVPIMFGLAWGVALVFYGLGIALLGISLGNSIVSGLGPAVGSLIPLIVLHREKVLAREGISILLGILIMAFGICFCGIAGQSRDMEKAELVKVTGPRRYGWGLLYCILGGVLAPTATLALAFGTPVMQRAIGMGVAPTEATGLVWLLFFPAGGFISILYCLYLMKKNKSWGQFRNSGTGRNWFLVLAMCGLWLGAIDLYGVSTVYLGPLGVPIGQALFVVFTILGANVIGFLLGEWRGARGAPMRYLATGIALLTISCLVIAIGNR